MILHSLGCDEDMGIVEIKTAYGEKINPLILFDSKRDIAKLLGKETEVRSIREHLQKKQEQKAVYYLRLLFRRMEGGE